MIGSLVDWTKGSDSDSDAIRQGRVGTTAHEKEHVLFGRFLLAAGCFEPTSTKARASTMGNYEYLSREQNEYLRTIASERQPIFVFSFSPPSEAARGAASKLQLRENNKNEE